MPQKPYRGLDQLMDGAITKRFNDELTRLWDNVYDMRAPRHQGTYHHPQGDH